MVPKMQIGSGIGFPRGIRNRVRSSPPEDGLLVQQPAMVVESLKRSF
jgi:hypothetical protein